MIHSDDDSNHSSSSDSSRSSKDSEKSSERYPNTSSIRSLVQTCNYEGLNIKNKRRERTYNPTETGFYAITVNLIIFEEVHDEIHLLFQKANHNEIKFHNPLDFSASGYILAKETAETAMCRIAKKELDININEDEVRNMYLLSWLPNDDNNKCNLKHSKGYLYILNRKVVDVKTKLFKSINVTKCLDNKRLQFKLNIKALLSDNSMMTKITNLINKKFDQTR